jgi:hypothetical protein
MVSGDRSLMDEHRIDEGSLQAAEAVTRWFCQETERVYGVLAESDQERDQRILVELIRRNGDAITVRQLQQTGRRWRGSAEEARAALDGLVQAHLARWESPPPGKAGGHPSEVCRLIEGGNGNGTHGGDPTSGGSVTVTTDEDPGNEVRQWTR